MLENLSIFVDKKHWALSEGLRETSIRDSIREYTVDQFTDREVQVCIPPKYLIGKDVYFLYSLYQMLGFSHIYERNLMELLLLIRTARDEGAKRITAIIPYFGYARQHKKYPGQPFSAKLVADLLVAAGVSRVVTIDIHREEIVGFFNVPAFNLYPAKLFADDICSRFAHQIESQSLVIAPLDNGSRPRAKACASLLNVPIIDIAKDRERPDAVEGVYVLNSVKNWTVIIVDDIISTATSLQLTSHALVNRHAKEVHAYVTHFTTNCDSEKQIRELRHVKSITITDSLPIPIELYRSLADKLNVLFVGKDLADTILHLHENIPIQRII